MKTLILAMLFAALMGYCLMPRVAPRVIEDIPTPIPTPYPVTPNWPRRTPAPATPATPKPWAHRSSRAPTIRRTDRDPRRSSDQSAMSVRLPSLELSWLSRSDKQLPTPAVVFAPIETGGLYHTPQRGELFVNGLFVPHDAGIIVISTNYGDAGSTLAHEWRHHWQWCNGWTWDATPWHGGDDEDYDAELRRFFSASAIERDALRFELSKERADYHDEWWRILEPLRLN